MRLQQQLSRDTRTFMIFIETRSLSLSLSYPFSLYTYICSQADHPYNYHWICLTYKYKSTNHRDKAAGHFMIENLRTKQTRKY